MSRAPNWRRVSPTDSSSLVLRLTMRKQGPRTRVANLASLVGRPPADFFLDRIQGPDALDRFGRNRRAVRFHQVVELAADMGETGCFLDRAVLVELIETRVSVGL